MHKAQIICPRNLFEDLVWAKSCVPELDLENNFGKTPKLTDPAQLADIGLNKTNGGRECNHPLIKGGMDWEIPFHRPKGEPQDQPSHEAHVSRLSILPQATGKGDFIQSILNPPY